MSTAAAATATTARLPPPRRPLASSAPPLGPPPRRCRLPDHGSLTLITKHLAYLAPGQAGTQPSFVVRPGEGLRMRVDNKDAYKHSFTFAPSKVDLDAGTVVVS